MSDAGQRLYAVIPAGGSGTRLWPLSRAAYPKFLHPLTGSAESLLQATVARLAPLIAIDRTYVVTGIAHAAGVARQLPNLPEANILVEPAPADSGPAIGLAAAIIAERDPEAIMASFASDHLIRDQAAFVSTIEAAALGAAQGYLMTVGIQPTCPETGYGYLRCGEPLHQPGGEPLHQPGGESLNDERIRRVEEFKEKPNPELAAAYLAAGTYLWNASMFVWQVQTFLGELRERQPDLYLGLTAIARAWRTPEREAVLGEVWPTLPRISVDHAVMEPAAAAGRVATVPGAFGWSDIGDFHTLGEALAADGDGNVVLADAKAGPVLLPHTRDSVVVAQSHRVVAALGVHDLIVVDTDDALLVCARDRAQEVKALVERLRARGEEEHL
ncbi:MAG: mannose-1-phosphate guanylyltransferase [Micromonosporaceae bacterium]